MCDYESDRAIFVETTCDTVGPKCEVPPAFWYASPDRPPVVKECFKCGLPTCLSCSSIRKYLRYGRQRLCDKCQEEEDETPYFVLRRYAVRDGYSPSEASAYVREGFSTPAEAKRKAAERREAYHRALAARKREASVRRNINGRKIA